MRFYQLILYRAEYMAYVLVDHPQGMRTRHDSTVMCDASRTPVSNNPRIMYEQVKRMSYGQCKFHRGLDSNPEAEMHKGHLTH